MDQCSWVVVKFGGTSVSSRSCWDNIRSIVSEHLSACDRVLIVCSALAGATNVLQELGQKALLGQHQEPLQALQLQYQTFAESLQVDSSLVEHAFADLAQRLQGIALIKELTPRTQAELLAAGERILTEIACVYLLAHDVGVEQMDAAQLLSMSEGEQRDEQSYLSAICESTPDLVLQDRLSKVSQRVILTQGFLAGNARGETVLLGRGGSDVSAAYFAAKLQATRCEIWTDVAGVYTANPHVLPKARVIRGLRYEEAQEIAAMGGKVLHPNALPPLKRARIPLWIRQTTKPESAGTEVSWDVADAGPAIKSVLVKKQVILISIEAVSMWQSVGFLADTFDCFKRHGLSVDLMSTAESCITVSLDVSANLLDAKSLQAMLDDLNKFANAKTIGPCAAISLVGQGIRAILSELSDVFSQFQSHKIYLVSQAANDLNLTFVVDEEQADRLCQRLHYLLIENRIPGEFLGEEWQAREKKNEDELRQWWELAAADLAKFPAADLPAYVYSQQVLARQVDQLQSLTNIDQLFYAMKANSNREVLSYLISRGMNIECVSWGEIQQIRQWFPDLSLSRLLFTPNFAPREEYAQALAAGILLTLDSEYPLDAWPDLFADHEVILRLDPGQGKGHHKHVMTAGQAAKFGLPVESLPEFMDRARASNVKVVGLHGHAGSGVLDAGHWANLCYFLSQSLEHCPDVEFINCGGGLGIAESPWQTHLDMVAVNESLAAFKCDFPEIKLWLEPGRYVVAESGVLLARVTQVKKKGDKTFVGVETGMNTLLRPALYGAYHPIVNLTRLHEPHVIEATVVGPICESADVLGYDRLLPNTQEGDILAIGHVGAYGETMSSSYNMRSPAKSSIWGQNIKVH